MFHCLLIEILEFGRLMAQHIQFIPPGVGVILWLEDHVKRLPGPRLRQGVAHKPRSGKEGDQC